MNVIVCVDVDNGIMFNNRRQSRDRAVIRNIMELVGDKKLWMNNYSAVLFEKLRENICVDEQFLDKAQKEDFCFVENCHIVGIDIHKMILYRWDKKYPADFKLNVDMDKYILKSTLEFEGYSHETIIREVYEKNER